MNPRVYNKNRKESKKYPLQNKYVGVRRTEFEEANNGNKLYVKYDFIYVKYYNLESQ
jgi:hypothetical protein